jgi:polyphosphate kinase
LPQLLSGEKKSPGNAGQEEIYLGSADMMPRNLNRGVEVDFPVRDPKLVGFLRDEVLAVYLADVVKARHMKSDGTYDRPSKHDDARSMNAQEWFIKKVAVRSSSTEVCRVIPCLPANSYDHAAQLHGPRADH